MIIWPVRWTCLKITMTPRVAQQLLDDIAPTPKEKEVFERAAEALVKSIRENGGTVS
jgi:hypothetical protein